MIKVEDVVDPLNEASERVAEALILFCQVSNHYSPNKLDLCWVTPGFLLESFIIGTICGFVW